MPWGRVKAHAAIVPCNENPVGAVSKYGTTRPCRLTAARPASTLNPCDGERPKALPTRHEPALPYRAAATVQPYRWISDE
ncbi:hypothetical protein Tamer19_12790 [Cupriavidus sp. TA19]|nr:hypothetical protein Tamer19_12790 [Cupriavidus sp. TA19]